jgi:hypothetical protein
MANVNTPEFRMNFPKLFKAEKNDMNGKMEYSVTALFTKGQDLSVLKKAAQEAIEKKWGKDKDKWPANLKTPFRDQGEKAKKDDVTGKMKLPPGYEAGAVFLTLKSTERPAVVNRLVQPIADESEIYSGCVAIASVRAYAYDQKGNRGVAFGLNHVQKVRDGEPLGGRTKPEDEFAPIEDAEGTPAAGSLANGKDATSIFG